MSRVKTPRRDISVVHPGVQHSGQLAQALEREGRLSYLVTNWQIGDDPSLPWSVPPLRDHLGRREIRGLPDARIRRIHPGWEIGLRLGDRLLGPRLLESTAHRVHASFASRAVQAIGSMTDIVIGTDGICHDLFTRLGRERPWITRVLDLAHPPLRLVLEAIETDARELGVAPSAYDDYQLRFPGDQLPEMMSAHGVVVASEFSASMAQKLGLPRERIYVIPYGVTPAPAEFRRNRNDNRQLRLLSLGAMSERKGLTVLLSAMRQLEQRGIPAELTIAGGPCTGYRLPSELPGNTVYIGSPSNTRVRELLATADVLVLPSMCEGFGRSLLEALSWGASVITTERSGGPDILRRCPEAPLTILRTADRHLLADLLETHHRDRSKYLRPSDAMSAAHEFSEQRYAQDIVAATDAIRLSRSPGSST